eukprot:520705_1
MQFRSILLIIYLFTTSLSNAYNKSINAPLDFVGGHSGVGDDLISYAWCDTAEKKIISCGIQNLHGNNYLDGSEVIVDGNTPGGFKCMAQNGYANGGSVIARAACSDPNNLDPTKLHCSYEYSEPEWSSTCNDCTTTVSCPDNKIMVSCSIRSNDASIDGVYIGTKNQQHHITSSTVCTAQNNGSPDPTGPGGVWAQAVCCEYEDYGYELDCKTKWSALNSGWLTVTCDDGYDLMGCSGTGDFNSLTSYYISENKCLAYGMPENGPNLRAVATCCRLYKAPTPSPTVNPTSETLDPTNSPSTAPTSPPSVSPSMSPTSPPTLSPSMSPTDCNEYKNETSNDGFEETIDDIISEIKFINIITNENKTFNVLETAEYTANTKRLPAFENDIFQQLSCFGDVSCLKSTIAFSNNSICNLLCDQFLSCMAADVTIGQCKEVSIICNGQQSCDGMIVDINSTGIDNGSIIIECGIKSSCNNMVIDIIGNQNVVTNISCYAPNACDNIDITVEDHTLSTLKMYSYSDNAIFDNGVGLQESAGGRKLIQCNEKSKYIRWNKTLTNAEMRTLIKKEYSNNVFPCDNLQIKCAADENDTKSTAHCDINYNVTDPTITNPSTECYWIPVSEIVQLDCIGKCFTSPTASPTPAPTGTPTEPSINPTNAPTDIPTSTPSAAPTSPPTNIPSTAPTTAPTLSPTISPVYSPSISPTISPTLLPTISPTISPSLPPSKVPTLAPSVAPTRDPTEDVDDIFDMYIPITYKIQNLTRDNIDDIIYNPGLIIEEIREIIEQYFYFDEETLKYKDFWLEIEAVNEKNIFNGDILEGGDLGYRSLEKPLLLESKIETDRLSSGTVIKRSDSDKFRENTQKQLQFFFNNNTDLYFEVRNPSELKSLEKFPSKPPDDATVIILSTVIIGLGALCSLAAFIVNKKGGTKVDNSAFYVPILVALNIYDFISDVNLSVQILQNANPTVKDIVFLLGLASIAFIIIPFGSNLYYAMRINHQKVIRQNSSARVWFSKHLAPFILLCVASAGTYPVLSLSSSRLFGLDFFNAGLMSSDLHKLQKIKIRSSITLENAPQLVIQSLFLVQIGQFDDITVLSMIFSTISIIVTIASMITEKQILNSCGYAMVEFEVTGTSVIQKTDQCKNQVRIIRGQISSILGLNQQVIEIMRPIIVPNGLKLTIYIHLNHIESRSIDYKMLLNQCQQNGQLAGIIQNSWKLQSIPIISKIKFNVEESKDRQNSTVSIRVQSEIQQHNNLNNMNLVLAPAPVVEMTTVGDEKQVEGEESDQSVEDINGITSTGDGDVYAFEFTRKPFGLAFDETKDKKNIYVKEVDKNSVAVGNVVVGSVVIKFQDEYVENVGAKKVYNIFSTKYGEMIPLVISFRKPIDDVNVENMDDKDDDIINMVNTTADNMNDDDIIQAVNQTAYNEDQDFVINETSGNDSTF